MGATGRAPPVGYFLQPQTQPAKSIAGVSGDVGFIDTEGSLHRASFRATNRVSYSCFLTSLRNSGSTSAEIIRQPRDTGGQSALHVNIRAVGFNGRRPMK